MAAGLDSLGAVELRNALEGALGISLPGTLVFDYPSAGAIAKMATSRMPLPVEKVIGTAAAAVSTQGWVSPFAVAEAAPGQNLQNVAELQQQVAEIVSSIIGGQVDPSAPLMASGLDSLAAVELRNSLQDTFAVELPATLAMDYPTVAAVAKHIYGKLAAVTGPVASGMVQRAAGQSTAGGCQGATAVMGMAFKVPQQHGLVKDLAGWDAVSVVPYERYVQGSFCMGLCFTTEALTN